MVALILVPGIVVLGAVQTAAYYRGGFDSAFWRRTMDERLDGIAAHPREWAVIDVLAIAITIAVAGGVVGFARLVAEQGALTLTVIGGALILIASAVWLVGTGISVGVIPLAARQRGETGAAPTWIVPSWAVLYQLEIVYVVLANLAYVVLGLAILRGGYPSAWSGLASIASGGAVLGYAAIRRELFPQLAWLAPVLLGIAVIVG